MGARETGFFCKRRGAGRVWWVWLGGFGGRVLVGVIWWAWFLRFRTEFSRVMKLEGFLVNECLTIMQCRRNKLAILCNILKVVRNGCFYHALLNFTYSDK